jgi:hypothetical protein
MKNSRIRLTPLWALLPIFLFPLHCLSAHFVELSAEIELNDWDHPFFVDRLENFSAKSPPKRPSLFRTNGLVRCVVGTNTWLIEVPAQNGKRMYWFTGTNLIQYFETTISGEESRGHCVISESKDGNPGRPVRVADRMTFDPGGRLSWLAFCSGTFLRGNGRQIYPPGDLWKQSTLVYSGWTDRTTQFDDALGLPKSLDLLATNNQPIFQYQTRHTTNVLGWTFPLEFYGVQYLPTASNLWKLHFTAKGRITAIGPGTEPHIPEKLLTTATRLPQER